MSSPEPEYTDIIICGCGPTGAYLSALLSRLGVHHIVLEKEFAITTDPRGIALDEDGIRALQSVGLYEPTFREIGKPMGIFNFIEAKGGDLSTRAFCKFDYRTIEGGTGHPGFLCHKQPSMEKHLRSAISSDFGQVKHGCEVDYIDEDEDGVLVGYKDIIGSHRCVRGKFLVAADGKTGFTRKKYLEPKGIVMERNPKADYEATWIAMNWHITLPTPTTHPNFPLFKLGYSPTEIYDLFFPDNFFFVICDSSRPAVFGRFGRNDDHLIRFEFVVKEGEDAKETSAVREASKIFLPYVTHPGKRYGLQGKVRWPEDCMTCIRSSAFSFTARSCNRWSRNRVILVGDSAHVFPPFGGQGISSGFRDALSLSWRLKIAVQEGCWFYEDLLMGWYLERKQQLERSLEATIVNGELLTESSKWKRFWRNWYFWFLQLVPCWRHDLELGGRKDGMIRYQWSKGMPFLQQFGGGKSFPQVFSAPLYAAAPEIPSFTDDAVFSQHKKGVFQLVALLTDLTELRIAQWELRKFFQAFDLTKLEMPGGRPKSEESMIAQIKQPDESTTFELLHPDETTFILHNVKRSTRPPENLFSEIFAEENSIRVIDAEEYEQAGVRHASSNRNPFPRPDAKFYNPNRIRKDLGFDMRFVIVRFDRVVYAACRSLDELRVALKGLQISIQDSCND